MTDKNTDSSRRDFLKSAGTAAAGLVAAGITGIATDIAAEKTAEAAVVVPVPTANTATLVGGAIPKGTVLAKGRVLGANDRINVAFVGVGPQGFVHVRNFVDDAKERNVNVVGICDTWTLRINDRKKYAVEKGGFAANTVQTSQDYRTLVDNKDIDAIVIATPEHWHSQVAIHAMQAGKHVYIEKPMSRYLDEAFQVHDTAKSTGRVVQVGAQRSSAQKYHVAGEAVRAGKIGPLVMGQDSYTRNSSTGEWNYGIDGTAGPANLDWNLWLGSAPKRPWANTGGADVGQQPTRTDAAARFFRYRKFTDYSAGILGDLMPHTLHPFLIASGNPEYPIQVNAIGTRKVSTDREVPDTVQVTAVFPSGWSMTFVGSTVNEVGLPQIMRGAKGTIYFGGGSVEVRPERPYTEEIEGGFLIQGSGSDDESVPVHERNWLECIRTGKTPNCNIDLATKVQTIISLAEMSIRWKKTMLFDPATRKITS